MQSMKQRGYGREELIRQVLQALEAALSLALVGPPVWLTPGSGPSYS